ncbi:hypothetical protein LguiA_013107 [Lonicera macranthoides]
MSAILCRGSRKPDNLKIEKIYIWAATNVATVAVEDIYLQFSQNRILMIKECLYVSSIRTNLISISRLVDDKYFVYFNDKSVIIRKK